MSQYELDLAASLAHVLERAAASQPEMFAGYVANLEFWCRELDHLHDVHDGHGERLETMRLGSARYLEAHHGTVHNVDEFGTPFQGVRETTTSRERVEAVKRCRNAFRKILQRALDLELIDLDGFDGWSARLERVRLTSSRV
jgi:hypothetical protein